MDSESFNLPAVPTFALDYQPSVSTNAVTQPSTDLQQQMISQLTLQQVQFQASQQKFNSKLALQLAQLTVKGAK